MFAAEIFRRFSHASFGVLASRISQACDRGHMSPRNTLRGLWIAPMLRIQEALDRLIFVHSFDVAPITLFDKVLVHLVLPSCEVVSIQLLARESAPHLSIHDCVDVDFPFFFFSLGHALCSVTTIAKSRFFSNVDVERNTRGWARSSYQTALIPCKESDMIMCSGRDHLYCVCVHERERESVCVCV